MKDYIQKALSTEAPITPELEERLRKNARVIHAIFGLSTEIGELTDVFKRAIFYGKSLDLANIHEELGDFLWYLAILMDHFSFDFEKCMEANIAKLKARYPNKFTEKDAVERNLEEERKILEDGVKVPSVYVPTDTPWEALIEKALKSGWGFDSWPSLGGRTCLVLKGDESEHWAARWIIVPYLGQTVYVPHWLEMRLWQIEQEK